MIEQDKPLAPTAFTPQESSTSTEPALEQRPGWLIPAMAGVIVTAVAVFFVLPLWVADNGSSSSNDTSSTITVAEDGLRLSRENTRPASSGAQASPDNERSPFAQAQLQKLRRAAQEALQKVLELQDVLEELEVERWGNEGYQAAIAHAQVGDTAYREQRFEEATQAYTAASEQLLILEASIPERITTAEEQLTQSVEGGKVTSAQEALALLEILAQGDGRLQAWRERVGAIETVSRALAAAGDAAQGLDFQGAITQTTRALTADPAHQKAAAQLARFQESLATQTFRKAMSDGYLALEQKRFGDAAAAFQTAASIRPGAQEPKAASNELASARTDAALRDLRTQGMRFEASEEWQNAVNVYTQALAIDDSLVFAREGTRRAQPRAALHAALETTLSNTERLVDVRAFNTAEATLQQAQAIASPGPVLSEQITKLQATLTYARTPVDVTFISDGVTDVTILRVERLGAVNSTTRTLRPGTYTALGIRTGYRDVRKDFQVVPGQETVVDVRCQESVGEPL